MSRRWLLLVARPTLSGVDHRSFDALAASVAAQIDDEVRVAHLDQADPSIHAVLDAAVEHDVEHVAVVPLAVPADTYLTTWIARAVANWRETRDPVGLDIRLTGGLATAPTLAGIIADLARTDGAPITASPAAFRSPAWSALPDHDRHLLVCRGPRCTARGAGQTHLALSKASRGTDTLVTPIGCLGPCNLGPLVVEQPVGRWHRHVDGEKVGCLSECSAADHPSGVPTDVRR